MGRANFLKVKLLTFALIGLIMVLLVSCNKSSQSIGGTSETSFVAVTQVVENAKWNAVRDGVKDALASAGYEEGETLRWEWQSAQGNPAAAAQIARKYAWANPDVIVAIAPQSAQRVVLATRNTPVIFSGVTDPLSAGLVRTINRPGSNTTGVSDLFPMNQQLALIKEILPEAKTLGIVYGASEAQSASLVKLVKEQAANQGFTEVKEAVVFETSGGVDAVRGLVGFVDAVYVPTDRIVTPALTLMVQVGQDNDLPVFSSGEGAAERGAIANISISDYDIGLQTGNMVVKVLEGSRPGDLPVEYIDTAQLSVNLVSAVEMGTTIPAAVIERADKVVESQAL